MDKLFDEWNLRKPEGKSIRESVIEFCESYAKRCEDAEKKLAHAEKIVAGLPDAEKLTRRLEVAEKETKPTIDGIPWYDFLSRVQKKLESAEARVKELEGKYEAKCEPERNGK